NHAFVIKGRAGLGAHASPWQLGVERLYSWSCHPPIHSLHCDCVCVCVCVCVCARALPREGWAGGGSISGAAPPPYTPCAVFFCVCVCVCVCVRRDMCV